MIKRISKSPPWDTYINELRCLLEEDADIKFPDIEGQKDNITFGLSDEIKLRIQVYDSNKREALQQLIPAFKEFGKIKVYVEFIPFEKAKTVEAVYEAAFKDNPVVAAIESHYVMGANTVFVSLSGRPAQFFDDNISDPDGTTTLLLEQIARDVLTEQPAFFSTERICIPT